MKNLPILSFFVLLLVFVGCDFKSDDEAILNEPEQPTLTDVDFVINDGVLRFSNYDNYQKMKSTILVMEEMEVQDFFSNLEFSSLNVMYYEFWRNLNEVEDESGFHELVEANSKYAEIITNEYAELEVVTATETLDDYFANENFIFQIGEDIIDVKKITENLQNPAARMCSNPDEEVYIKDESGCKKDRKAKLYSRTVAEIGNLSGLVTLEHQFRVKGQRKRFCIWIDYWTGLSFDSSFGMSMSSKIKNMELNSSTSDFLFTTCGNCLKLWHIDIIQFPNMINATGEDLPPNTTSARTRATTDGIGNLYVTMDCED